MKIFVFGRQKVKSGGESIKWILIQILPFRNDICYERANLQFLKDIYDRLFDAVWIYCYATGDTTIVQ